MKDPVLIQSQNQHQQLLVNMTMKQAFHVMQLPLEELSSWLEEEIESNPVLEIRSPKVHSDRTHPEIQIAALPSLYSHLMNQAPLHFKSREELALAELVIGHLNEKGYLDTPLDEILPGTDLQGILEGIQALDPPGVGARNLQECLLLQIKNPGLAMRIVQYHFEDLLHNRLPQIAKAECVPIHEVVETVRQKLVPLDLYPGSRFAPSLHLSILPDLSISCEEGIWKVEVNSSFLPQFHTAAVYEKALRESTYDLESTSYLRRQVASGNWLKTIVQKRNATLLAIGSYLLKKHRTFFEGERHSLDAVSMQEAAKALCIHESTVARAVANKYVACPQGILPLRFFFSQGVKAESGKTISSHSLRKMLRKMVDEEDKTHPFSDEAISKQFRKLGVPVARRTVSKYRASLNIAGASQRKEWSK
ncbi:MAG: RNA polymerase factor sigma-54 [Verrucomicrobia bacterium]|nr:RNA polymerase factor sigma-54 [Verrucomicrobiota bacterium]